MTNEELRRYRNTLAETRLQETGARRITRILWLYLELFFLIPLLTIGSIACLIYGIAKLFSIL